MLFHFSVSPNAAVLDIMYCFMLYAPMKFCEMVHNSFSLVTVRVREGSVSKWKTSQPLNDAKREKNSKCRNSFFMFSNVMIKWFHIQPFFPKNIFSTHIIWRHPNTALSVFHYRRKETITIPTCRYNYANIDLNITVYRNHCHQSTWTSEVLASPLS